MKIYIAVKYVDNYRGTEFPPSPLKLIQAIIAATQDQYMDVLNALEIQSPTIYACEIAAQYDYARFVINNDGRLEHVNAGRKKEDIVRSFGCADSVHVIYEYEVATDLMYRLSEAVGRFTLWAVLGIGSSLLSMKCCLLGSLMLIALQMTGGPCCAYRCRAPWRHSLHTMSIGMSLLYTKLSRMQRILLSVCHAHCSS